MKVSKKGFSLVEVMIIVALTASVIIPVFNIFIFSVRGTSSVTAYSTAVNLAEETMEILSNIPYDELIYNYQNYKTPLLSEKFTNNFEKRIKIKEIVLNKLVRIDIVVTYKISKRENSIFLTKLVARRD